MASLTDYNVRFLKLLPNHPWVRIHVVREPDPCLYCRSQPVVLSLDDLPALPHLHCGRRDGCACWYSATEPEAAWIEQDRSSAMS